MDTSIQHPLRRGMLLVLLASLFYLLVNLFARHLHSHLPIIQILFIQNGMAFCCMLPFIWKKPLRTPHWKIHIIRDLSGLASYFLLFQALKTTPLVDATTLHFTSPFFVPIISAFWFKEKFTSNIWLSLILGFAGMILILNPTGGIFEQGSVFALLAAIASAFAISAVRNLNIVKEPIERVLFFFFSAGMLVTFPACYPTWIHPTLFEWGILLAIGLSVVVNHFLLTRAFLYAPAWYLAPLSYSAIIYAVLFSWLIYEEPIGLRSLAGAFIITLGGTITYILNRKKQNLFLSNPISS
jgi:drug/metabolite transporter (DMT)-like permease